MCIHMRYAGLDHAIPVNSVNIFAVYYSHNTTASCHNLSATSLQLAASKPTGVPGASAPWFRLFAR